VLNFPPPLEGEGQGGGLNSPSLPPWEGQDRGDDVTVVAAPVTDTCKEVVDGVVRRTIRRDTLVDARGPWTFRRETLMQTLDRAGTGAEISTMIDLCRAARLRVRVLIPE